MTASAIFMLGLGQGSGLARSCNDEADWLISGKKTYPMIPGDGVQCRIPRCASHTHREVARDEN